MKRKITTLLLLFLVGAICNGQSPLTAENTSKPLGSGRWEWTIYIIGDPSLLAQVSCVRYELHETFPDRIRNVCERGTDPNQAFPLTASGWGVFNIPVTVTFKDGKTQTFIYRLRFE
jgi:transcription initiation factor IIF auxiliary subunit